MKLVSSIAGALTRHCALWMSLCLIAGCSFEVENPGKPNPKPETEQPQKSPASDVKTSSGSATQDHIFSNPSDILTIKPSAVKASSSVCNTVVTRGAPNSSGKDGVVIVLPAEVSASGSLLVLRDTQGDKFLNAAEQMFSSGTFSLEFYPKNERSCRFDVPISSDDVVRKIKITVDPS